MFSSLSPNAAFFIALAFLALGLVVVPLFGDNGIWQHHVLIQQVEEVNARVARLEQDNERLRREIRSLQRSPDGFRREAAAELLVAPPGSTIYRFSSAP